jgi:beta-glucanase (GH16 family)
MNKILLFVLFLFALPGCKNDREMNQGDLKILPGGYSTPENYSGMSLVWRDEFEGHNLNPSDWKHETGGSGWGNNELEYYQEKNTTVHDGYLIITAEKENVGGKNYTSSRIITQGKKEFQYGRVDIRALLPKGQGIWPALWMLGASVTTVGWPACGEIDIMEMIGGTGKDNTVHGTAHWDNGGSHASYGGKLSLAHPKIFADEFHVFSIVWTPTTITWYLDDVQYEVIDTTPSGLSELQNKFYFIFNVAVGGNWPGNPDATTTFPQRMIVDYIRIFQNN